MLGSIIIFIVVLSVLVLIHEGGHFFAAKRIGVWVEEFGLGLPPRAWGKKVGDTIYSLNWLPFGGFVRLHGENLEDTISNPKVAFLHKGKLARAFVIVAGVFMNLVLALVAFSVFYTFAGVPRDLGYVKVDGVADGSPAQSAGFMPGDKITSTNGEDIIDNDSFIKIIEDHKGSEVTITYQRGGESYETKVIPRENHPEGEGSLGVAISSSEIYFPPVWQRPIYGAYYGFKEAVFWGGAVISGLRGLVVDLVARRAPQDLAGPIGIYQVTSQTAALGILPLINFIGVLSVNLAIVNILPFPALDGGRLMFIIFEAITRKRVTPKIEAYIHATGMGLLLLLLLVITFFDIKRIGTAGNLPGFLQQFFN